MRIRIANLVIGVTVALMTVGAPRAQTDCSQLREIASRYAITLYRLETRLSSRLDDRQHLTGSERRQADNDVRRLKGAKTTVVARIRRVGKRLNEGCSDGS